MTPTRNDVPFSVPREKNTDEEEKPTGNNAKGKTYCYKYFRPYKNDWRLLLTNDSGESIGCTCPKARIHDQKCVWYNPNYINIPDTRNDLSISEKVAQGKSMTCTTIIPKMDNKNHVDVYSSRNSIYGSQVNL